MGADLIKWVQKIKWGADLIKWVQKIKWDQEDLHNSIRFRTDYFRNSLAIELIISEIASLGMSLTFVICPGWLSPLAPLLAPIFLLAYHVWNETDLLEIESTQPELSPVTQNVVLECSYVKLWYIIPQYNNPTKVNKWVQYKSWYFIDFFCLMNRDKISAKWR